ncbi:hypothetical protein [Paludibacter sp.]|uniref:hypothetical protein n=1 Tax=Paludibacter sp. TaxID=1898105 RepID=UPI0013523FEB|nr:hypothetical protein [Paludibacter sp.]MTK52136.1 hypothetical protein [Paludibacter sp.]
MANVSQYFDFIKAKGNPLKDINPGSKELSLNYKDALKAVELLKDCMCPILGGDILSEKQGIFGYAYQLWGSEYHCLNWYCEKLDDENGNAYCIRSYEIAKAAIENANKVAIKLGYSCYIVLVIQG